MTVSKRSVPTTDSFRTVVITDDSVFSQLAEQWDSLVARCSSSTPFQVHAWLNSWWRAYGEPGRLRVVVVYTGEHMVAAAPFFVGRRLSVRVLSPVGEGISDFSHILTADALDPKRATAIQEIWLALRDVGGWDIIDMPEVRPGRAVNDLVAQWPGRSSTTPSSTCLELPVKNFNDVTAALPRNTRKAARRKLRRIDQVGVTSDAVPESEVPAAVEHFHRLHFAQWKGRGIDPEHVRPRFRALLAEAVPLMVARKQAVVTEHRLDGEVLAVGINVVCPSWMGGYLAGISPALRDLIDVNTLLLRDDLERALERQTPVLSFLRGQEDYKLRWRPVPVQNVRIVLGRPGSLPSLVYVLTAETQSKVYAWMREHTPWVQDLHSRIRRLRMWSPRSRG